MSFELYKKKVVTALKAEGFKGDAEAFAECLDMSYAEHSELDPDGHHWTAAIMQDMREFKKENPNEFEIKH